MLGRDCPITCGEHPMRALFAALSGAVGLGAALLLLSMAWKAKERGSMGEVAIAVLGGAVALGLVWLAVRAARGDIDFRSRHKARPKP